MENVQKTLFQNSAISYERTALQAGRSRVRFPMMSLKIFIDKILLSGTMAVGLTQPLTEMSIRNISLRAKAAGA
jgi:hypothetical protein